MIRFILNNRLVETTEMPGVSLLDYIRYGNNLRGTKVGCREGDCGACTVIMGRLQQGRVVYHSVVSCLTPLQHAENTHVVTIEGVNGDQLNPVQQAIAMHMGTQCGFCTPGFVMSLMAHCMEEAHSTPERTIEAMGGNICRCTGYKSLERAALQLNEVLQKKDSSAPIPWLVAEGHLPGYFLDIPSQLKHLEPLADLSPKQPGGSKEDVTAEPASTPFVIAGGTDLMVQKPLQIAASPLFTPWNENEIKGISAENGEIAIGAGCSVTDIMDSSIMKNIFTNLHKICHLISSTPIRNMATLGGNLANASPIADLAIFFLATQATLVLQHGQTSSKRTLPLHQFFIDYKKIALEPGEFIRELRFPLPEKGWRFHFEKISKRNTLDIATVNSAMGIVTNNNHIESARLSIGGVAPIPLFLKKTSDFLKGKKANDQTLKKAWLIMDQEIQPIGDIRGSAQYKRLLARQLLFAHFHNLFPGSGLSVPSKNEQDL